MAEDASTDFLHQTLLGDAWANAEVGAVVFDDDRNFITMNHAYCRLTGYTRSELTRLRAGEDLVADQATRDEFAATVAAGRRFGRGLMKRKDGTTMRVEWITVPTRVSLLPYFLGLVWEADG